jgi:tRNA 2-thiouridine synthesizing protein A
MATILDLKGLKCPLPALRTRKVLRGMMPGDEVLVHCTDPLTRIDIPNLLHETGDLLRGVVEADGVLIFQVQKGARDR